ncbi:MAG: hypothetical protein U0Z53_13515 [Blastocatellia bacterium]
MKPDYLCPRIEVTGRADDLSVSRIPVSGDDALLGLVVSQLNKEAVDCNSVKVQLGTETALPQYVGNIRKSHSEYIKSRIEIPLDDLTFIEAMIPAEIETGFSDVSVVLENGLSSNHAPVHLISGLQKRPKIVTVRNGMDYGTDIYSTGPKSFLNLYVQDLDESANVNSLRLSLDEEFFAPSFVGFVPENGTWQVNAQLPVIEPGVYNLKLYYGMTESEIAKITIR